MSKYSMLESTRGGLIEAAAKAGWNAKTKADGSDQYKKLICFQAKGVLLFVDKNIGISKSGDINYLKIYVHPDQYIDPENFNPLNVQACINRQTKKNLHSHSALQGFPYFEGKGEPCGKAYKLMELCDWESFLSGFAGCR